MSSSCQGLKQATNFFLIGLITHPRALNFHSRSLAATSRLVAPVLFLVEIVLQKVMADAVAPTVAFRQHEFPQAPQPTISLPEASLQSHSSAPSRSPSPFIKEEPQSDEKRPAKKRKSWGQELPTPKTNLPPRYDLRRPMIPLPPANHLIRKRAKTEDEKEQRRIERVLRNRAAAQSSRERKRQEVEKLEGEKSAIEQQNQYLKDRLMAAEHEKFLLNQKVAKMSAQITSLREGSSTPLAADTPAPEPDTFDQTKIKQEIDDHIFSLSAPQLFSSPSTMTYSPSLSPSQPSLSFDGDSLATSPDMTQHPAAMLCDLQCQSVGGPRQVNSRQCTEARTVTPSSSATTAAIFLTLVSTVYSQLMIPLYTIRTSLAKARRKPMASHPSTPSARPTLRSPTLPTSLLIRWLTSTLSTTTTTNNSLSRKLMTSPPAHPTHRLRLLQRLLLSSPPLARPLKDATGRTLRGSASSTMSSSRGFCRGGHDIRDLNGSRGRSRQDRSVRSRRRGKARNIRERVAKRENVTAFGSLPR